MDAPSERTRVRRLHERAAYEREEICSILDAALSCSVGYIIDGRPCVTPTAHWREGDHVYWHGSSASRALRAQTGVEVCFTVHLLDGLVFARSGFNHSMNYRSVMAFGQAEIIADPEVKTAALRVFTERLAPGRWAEIRGPSVQELKATTILRMSLDEASAKVRTGAPHDDEEDYALPVWAGVLPFALVPGVPVPDERLQAGTVIPEAIKQFRR